MSASLNRFGESAREPGRPKGARGVRPTGPVSVRCPYCGELARLKDSGVVYGGRSYGLIWDCRPCDAYVGVHKGTSRPLGRLANAELRKWKQRAHAAFDPLWKARQMGRRDAYLLLAQLLGIDAKEAHIGMFDVDRCKALIKALAAAPTAAPPAQQPKAE